MVKFPPLLITPSGLPYSIFHPIISFLRDHLQLTTDGGRLGLAVHDEQRRLLASSVRLASASVRFPFSTKFGGADNSSFVGCMRDVSVNRKFIIPAQYRDTSLNVTLGCNRQVSTDGRTEPNLYESIKNNKKLLRNEIDGSVGLRHDIFANKNESVGDVVHYQFSYFAKTKAMGT